MTEEQVVDDNKEVPTSSPEEQVTSEDTVKEVEESKDEQALSPEESLQDKLRQAESNYLRLHAEWDNYRKRSKTEIESMRQYCLQNLITSLLPIVDNFERALSVTATNKESESLLQGMEMIKKQLSEILENEGVKEIEAYGQQFDPYFHQAVMQDEDSEKESNVVLEVLQKGYILKDRVIRPAMVKVNQ